MRRFAAIAFVFLVILFTVPAFAAKPKRPPVPLASELTVELQLTHPRLDADVLSLWKGLEESARVQPPSITSGVIAGYATAKGQRAAIEAAEHATPMWETLSNYPFHEHFEAEIRRNFGATGLSASPRFVVFTKDKPAASATSGPLSASGPTSVLVLAPRYWMSANFRELTIQLVLSHIERGFDKKGRPREEQLFQRAYAWRYQMPTMEDAEVSDYAQQWNRLGAQRLTDMVDQGIVQSVALFLYDFSEAGRLEDEKVRYGVSDAPAPAGSLIKQGWVGGMNAIPGLVGMVPSDWPVPASTFREASTTVPDSTIGG
jgi:hypothetical protein